MRPRVTGAPGEERRRGGLGRGRVEDVQQLPRRHQRVAARAHQHAPALRERQRGHRLRGRAEGTYGQVEERVKRVQARMPEG